jgi:hypothetical protein
MLHPLFATAKYFPAAFYIYAYVRRAENRCSVKQAAISMCNASDSHSCWAHMHEFSWIDLGHILLHIQRLHSRVSDGKGRFIDRYV